MKSLVLLTFGTFILHGSCAQKQQAQEKIQFKVVQNSLLDTAQNNFGKHNVETAREDSRSLLKSVIIGNDKDRDAAVARLAGDAVNMATAYVLNPKSNLDPKLRAKFTETLMTFAADQLLKTV